MQVPYLEDPPPHTALCMQVPYLEDPNTGVALFESAAIAQYLRDTYGPPKAVAA